MSGLCGWFGARPGAIAPRPNDNDNDNAGTGAGLLEAMAAPLTRFDASTLHRLNGNTSALQVAARNGSAHLYQQDGLLIALWGTATLSTVTLNSATLNPAMPAPTRAGSGLCAALAQLWRTQGPKACASLCGAFALCIVDETSGEALLAIDRSGTHTLSYQHTASGLVFGSSGAALTAHPATRRQIDPQAIYHYLYFHAIPAPVTIYSGQQRLLPGQYLHYRNGKFETGKYWQITFQERAQAPFGALKEQFLDTLRASVRASIGQRCIDGSDDIDGVGAFLSGGTDSTTLSIILGQVSGAPARTYSIGFDAPGYDEMAYARIAAHHCGSAHHEFYVTPDDVVRAIPQIAAIFDQPFGNASAVPAFYCAKMAAADGVTRLLGGDGGDELFGGNERYARQALFARYERVPMLLRQCLIEPLLFKFAGQQALFCKARSYIEQALVPLPGRLETYNLLQRYGFDAVLEPDFLARIDPGLPLSNLNDAYWLTHGHSQINQMLALDLKYTLADNDLPKVVKACELAGVEVAFPFLSDAMVAFSARLTPRQKLNGTRLRYFFKQALSDILPRAILRKQKHGFGLPFGLWLQQHRPLRELAFDSLSDLKRRRIVRPSFIDDLQQRHLAQHPGYHGTMVWVLMMLEQWFQQHQVAMAESGMNPEQGWQRHEESMRKTR